MHVFMTFVTQNYVAYRSSCLTCNQQIKPDGPGISIIRKLLPPARALLTHTGGINCFCHDFVSIRHFVIDMIHVCLKNITAREKRKRLMKNSLAREWGSILEAGATWFSLVFEI
ncbi:uncharacterized protein NPIL_530221 [Nephila pilipes]|uniref:Uncharacterized protein n=1 Tax=Nephila pilipes TaxID=299642 RepID=A0A8X6T4F6_NEPPI|nr:uncharacterized protein NPIL_530221 [Nephila pilipes]